MRRIRLRSATGLLSPKKPLGAQRVDLFRGERAAFAQRNEDAARARNDLGGRLFDQARAAGAIHCLLNHMSFDVIRRTYALAVPALAVAAIDEVVDAALVRAHEKHADFERFAPAIEFLSTVFFTDHSNMPLDDYFEALYCAAKHADFSKPWRVELRRKPPAMAEPAPAIQ